MKNYVIAAEICRQIEMTYTNEPYIACEIGRFQHVVFIENNTIKRLESYEWNKDNYDYDKIIFSETLFDALVLLSKDLF